MADSAPVLIIDDDAVMARSCQAMLRAGGIDETYPCTDAREALDMIRRLSPGAILLDLTMPYVSGQDLLRQITRETIPVPVIVFTGDPSAETAVECMRGGAFDYLIKPVDPTRLVHTVRRALEMTDLRREYDGFRRRVFANEIECPEAFSDIVATSAAMRRLLQYADTIAHTKWPVLITGETGTGKDLLARAIHRRSGRTGEFVAVNAGGIDSQLFADALFGHVRGAYSGADRSRPGAIASAQGGTLFLDEIGELQPASQVKLLRLLEQGEYCPLGSDVVKHSDARVIVATHRDLRALMDAGAFRADLFYRLQTHQLHVPALRDRPEDINVLASHFVRKAAESLGTNPPELAAEALELLRTHQFQGNVRELQGMISDAVCKCTSGTLGPEEFLARLSPQRSIAAPAATSGLGPFANMVQLPTLADAEKLLVEEAMRRGHGNQTVAARLLGITQSGLSRALKRMGIRGS